MLVAPPAPGCSPRVRVLLVHNRYGSGAPSGKNLALVLPSTWFEGFPMVFREAFAFGTPASVSDLRPLPGLVEDGRAGVVFRDGDPGALLAAVREAWADPAGLAARGPAARAAYEARYAEGQNLAALQRIYEAVLAVRSERRGRPSTSHHLPWRYARGERR
jgi:glycosyl transferase family 1